MANYDGSVWNLHGLWPDKITATACVNQDTCTSEQYSPSSFSSNTRALLDSGWVGLYNSIDTFRSHEWTKHGTCWNGSPLARGNGNQENFFLTTLTLHQKYNIYKGLAQAGIKPSDSTTYSLSSVVNALKSVLSSGSGGSYVTEDMIQVQCQSSGGKSLLTQVYLCLDQSYRPMNCNCGQGYKGVSNGCSSSIYYPTF